jgi:hypothetical protein
MPEIVHSPIGQPDAPAQPRPGVLRCAERQRLGRVEAEVALRIVNDAAPRCAVRARALPSRSRIASREIDVGQAQHQRLAKPHLDGGGQADEWDEAGRLGGIALRCGERLADSGELVTMGDRSGFFSGKRLMPAHGLSSRSSHSVAARPRILEQ